MKKSLQGKFVKLFGKLYTLNVELLQLCEELTEERDNAEDKFNELDEKLNEADDPSDSLCERHTAASDAYDELEEAVGCVECARDELESGINELMQFLDPSETEAMVKMIEEEGKKQNVTLPKVNLINQKIYQMRMDVVDFEEDSSKGLYRLVTDVSTNLQGKKKSITWQWDGMHWTKVDNGKEMPYMNEEFKNDFYSKLDDCMAQLWESRLLKGLNVTISKEYD